MTEVHARVADEIRARPWPDADGDLWLCFLDRDGRLILCSELTEGTGTVDELFLRDLAAVIREVGAPYVVLAVRRTAGRPQRPDRLMWQSTTQRLAGTRVTRVDLLVIGDDGCWSPRPCRRAA